ncbi:MAG: NAD(+) diphosphatase [Amaricoccus sp.]
MRDAEAVTFAGSRLDRASHLRGEAAQATLAADPAARCLPLWQGRPLLAPGEPARLGWLPLAAEVFEDDPDPVIFLGMADGSPRYARNIPDWPGAAPADAPRPFLDSAQIPHPRVREPLAFGDLRAVMAALTAEEAGTAAAAKGILGWHASHRFCANCGAPSEVADAGWRRSCPACGTQHFPRTDPVVIMLILSGNALLLGRQAAWPPGMYSLLAGFMEPGESIEAAVRRETFEEAGIPVGQVDYLSSQPWPFPSSLMLGCRGEALAREIHRDPAELEDARWVRREDVLTALDGRNPDFHPARRGSIARFLIERWLADRLD